MENTRTVVNINTNIEFVTSTTLLEKIPYFKGKLIGSQVNVEIPIEIKLHHFAIIEKILKGSRILAMIDVNSHLDVLIILKLAMHLEIPMEVISTGFAGWVESRQWIELYHPEYLYLIYLRNEDLVDFRKFFRLHKQPFKSIVNATELPEIRADSNLYIEMLLFFKNYNFNICFDHNNDIVQSRIDSLNEGRNAIGEIFLINPHSEFMNDYFKYIPTNYSTWDCANISIIPTPKVGDDTIAPYKVAQERFTEFTYGLFDKPLNDNVQKPFPFANVVIAGGAAAKILGANYNRKNARQSDADIFIFAKTFNERSRIFEEILDWFKTYDPVTRTSRTYYAVRGSVTTIYVKDIARKFQIISSNRNNPFEIISKFDLSHIQWCILNEQFLGTPEACKAMREKVTRFSNMGRIRPNRLIKALHCGYSIYKDPAVIEHVDITQLITPIIDDTGISSQPIQLQKMIRDLYGFWYPKSDPDMEIEEERQHNLCQAEKDSNANLVTDDPNFVLNNVVIGGSFESDYESTLYNTFNSAMIVNGAQRRRINRILLRSKHSVIRLTSCILKVIKIIANEIGLEIIVKSDDEQFRDFCKQLEGPVFRMFHNGGVSEHILNDMSEMKFTVPRYRLDRQDRDGVSCLRSQRGAALNIEEDLKVGDDIQIMFVIEITIRPEERVVNLKPIRFVKYVKYDHTSANTHVNDEDIDKEINALASESNFQGEIEYEEVII